MFIFRWSVSKGSRKRWVQALSLTILSIGLLVSGIIIFSDTFSENSFPKGEKEKGRTYIVQGEIHGNFKNDLDGNRYNGTTDLTLVPLSVGEGWEENYLVKGDVRSRYSPYELVTLETQWDEEKSYDEQIWEISHYTPPHVLYGLSIFLILLGSFLILTPLMMVLSKSEYRTIPMLNYVWPLLLFFPAYCWGVEIYDLCLVMFSGMILLTISPLVLVNYFIMKGSGDKVKYSFFFILINGPLSVLIGFSCGLVLSNMYIDFWP